MNKILLQNYLQDFIRQEKKLFSNYKIIFSTSNDRSCTMSSNQNESDAYLEILQRHDIEEADLKIIIHMNHAVKEGYTNIYLLSFDTDVIVLSLYFFKTFATYGLQVHISSLNCVTFKL